MRETFIGAAVGLALLVAGSWAENEACTNIGTFILPLAFVWGGLMKGDERFGVRITLLIIGGVLLAMAIHMLTFSGFSLGNIFG
jgi:hypothetical protein